MENFLCRYYPALLTHLVHICRLPRQRAEDLLQGFLMEKVLQQRVISGAAKERGRFRTYLLRVLDNYVASAIRKERTLKRSPQGEVVDVDELAEVIPGAAITPAAAVDTLWAREVIMEALRRTQAECETTGRPQLWELFDARVLKPILDGEEAVGYEDMVATFGFATPATAYNALTTAKRMYARHLEAVIREYARTASEIKIELDELRLILAGGSD